LSLGSQKYSFGIRNPEKPIPVPGSGSKKARDPGSATLLPATVFVLLEDLSIPDPDHAKRIQLDPKRLEGGGW
jgi:hypothetical protein